MNNIPLLTLIWSLELNPSETLFLARLADYADENGAQICIPAKRLARDCRLSICSVRRQLSKWRTRGVLIVTKAGVRGRPSQYALNVPELEAMQMRVREAKEAHILKLVIARDAYSGRARRAALTTYKNPRWLGNWHDVGEIYEGAHANERLSEN